MTSTPSALNFGAFLNTVSLNLIQSGSNSVSVESIVPSADMALPDGSFPIRFDAPNSADGFGVYSFSIDRNRFSTGALSGSITFNLSNNTAYEVQVSAVNQVAQGAANTAAVSFIIERLNGDDFEIIGIPFTSQEGVRGGTIEFPELESGEYQITFGTDTDNDGMICDEGELCGTFPISNFGFEATFVLDQNITDAEFLLQDLSNIALSNFDGTREAAIVPRSPPKDLTALGR